MKNENNSRIYYHMQRMAGLTVTMVLAGKLTRAKKLMGLAERLFLKGNYRTRNAVTNVYVYNLSSILQLHHYNVQALFPKGLQREYIKQINAF